ncbi:hypothetical protein ROHU_024091 [Labeo rohita]|uniref:DUF6729 domain-containing protein n=1 Tax=Labeo rohita TaxID=84645 RepID=A0A498MPE9_LABRO|nr:hypothetical protein ROHU_024091 [Labeo rohita]
MSQTVRNQLDLPHQKMFRLILTRKYACDIRVIRLLRDRTLGNSPTRLVRQLKENHGQDWPNRLANYLGECADFVDRPSLFPVVCQEPPEPVDIPTSRWLLSVYFRDILCRTGHIKASITSIFGNLLKLDSTKKTGQPLVVDPDSEVTENMLEHVDEGEDEENEGFGEDQTHDITVSSLTDDPSFSVSSHFLPFSESLSSTQSAAPSSQPASSSTVAAASSTQCAASSTQLGTPFAQPADSCTQPAALSTQPAASSTSTAPSSTLAAASSTPGVSASPDESVVSNIVALWQNLLDYDKQRVVFAARHQSRLDTERFRSPKKRQEFTPGVESVKRHALTTTAPLAQWPDCCRLIETIFVKLCAIHKSPKKKGIDTFFRWDLILEDYRKIRQCILTNAAVMQQTTLQLVDVSHTTLVQWHNRRVKKQDSAVLMQGLQLPSRLSVAADPLLPANVRLPSAPPPTRPSLPKPPAQ